MKRMIFTLLSFLLCAVFLTAALPVSADDGAAVSVGSASGKAGDTVTVNVNLSENPGVIAMELNVGYDEKQLELVGVNDGGVLNGYASPSSYGGGSYTLNWEDGLSTTNNNGTGTIATMTFKLKEDCNKANISISGKGHDADVNAVSVSASGGTITNTEPKTTTTKPTTTKPTTTKPTTTKKVTTTAPATRHTTTSVYTRSYNEQNTYPIDFEIPTTSVEEESSTTEVLDLFEEITESTTLPETTFEETTAPEVEKENVFGKLSKTRIFLIALMAGFALVAIGVIVSMVRKSK